MSMSNRNKNPKSNRNTKNKGGGRGYYDRYHRPSSPYIGSITGLAAPDLPRTPKVAREDAAFMSALSPLVSLIPGIGKGVGFAMSLPDLGYDISDFMKNPSWGGAGHIILDGINRLTPFTKTPVDDYLQVLGAVDDGASSQGFDVFDWLDKTFSNKSDKRKKKAK